jgi:hypothetical protein
MLGTMSERLTAQRVLVRDMPDQSRIIATLRISQYGDNAHPHFSATADIYEAVGRMSGRERSRRSLEAQAGGCQHGAILEAFPGAIGFVRMHLCDFPSGEPMHAEANGFYYLTARCADYNATQGYWWQRNGLEALREAWRLDDVRDLPWKITEGIREGGLTDEHRDAFHAFYEAQRPRWAAEARTARELLELMPDANDLRGYDTFGEPIERKPLPAWLIGADPEIVDI